MFRIDPCAKELPEVPAARRNSRLAGTWGVLVEQVTTVDSERLSGLRFMGLDIGKFRIGIAISDETGLIAQGLTTLQRVSWQKDLHALSQAVEKYQVRKIVVGHPINLDGSTGTQAEAVQDFVNRLREVTTAEIVLWDERFSSFSAEQVLIEGGMRREKRKKVVDKLAAVIILQSYLDHEEASRVRLASQPPESNGQG